MTLPDLQVALKVLVVFFVKKVAVNLNRAIWKFLLKMFKKRFNLLERERQAQTIFTKLNQTPSLSRSSFISRVLTNFEKFRITSSRFNEDFNTCK